MQANIPIRTSTFLQVNHVLLIIMWTLSYPIVNQNWNITHRTHCRTFSTFSCPYLLCACIKKKKKTKKKTFKKVVPWRAQDKLRPWGRTPSRHRYPPDSHRPAPADGSPCTRSCDQNNARWWSQSFHKLSFYIRNVSSEQLYQVESN